MHGNGGKRTLEKQVRKCKYVLCLLWMLLSLGSIGYIATWQMTQQAGMVIDRELEKQDAGRWRSPLMKEMECFPVQGEAADGLWYYEDGYGEGRSYGGARKHEGIDIMSRSGIRGELPIQSVSDGVVEQLGWLKLGGYRVGIRSTSGLYYYYAHLDSYAKGLQKGDRVTAGQLLGYMGDSGYGPEGTRGQFAVHLHFGIYFTEGEQEKSLNPFYLLQYQECGMILEGEKSEK